MDFQQPIGYTRGRFIFFDPESQGMRFRTPMEIIPQDVEDQVHCFYIAGPQGCGKSTFIGNLLNWYMEFFPDMPIYLFSRKDSDEALDNIPELNRIQLNEKFLEYPIEEALNDFADSIVVFDDIESIPDKTIKKKVYDLQNDLIKTGRSSNITVIATNHQIRDWKKTRDLLNEASHIILFPKANWGNVECFLRKHLNIGKRYINMVKNLDGRWICYHGRFPNLIMSPYEIIKL